MQTMDLPLFLVCGVNSITHDVLPIFKAFCIFTVRCFRNVSSVGLERRLDRAEVTGSNPVRSTKAKRENQTSRLIFEPGFFVENSLLRGRLYF